MMMMFDSSNVRAHFLPREEYSIENGDRVVSCCPDLEKMSIRLLLLVSSRTITQKTDGIEKKGMERKRPAMTEVTVFYWKITFGGVYGIEEVLV